MPYYLYRFGPLDIPERVGEEAGYRAARARLDALRAQSTGAPPGRLRMVFASNEIEATDLLTNPRPPDPSVAAEDD
ncbi:MAG: hypothetical protein AB7P21_12060 [Lautropia sp.]